jgi:hypothetical protein
VARAKRVKELCAVVGLDEDQIIPFSAHAHIGRDELAATLMDLLAAGPWREEPVYVPKAEGASDAPVFSDDVPEDGISSDGSDDDA